jgi:hypothetical protein
MSSSSLPDDDDDDMCAPLEFVRLSLGTSNSWPGEEAKRYNDGEERATALEVHLTANYTCVCVEKERESKKGANINQILWIFPLYNSRAAHQSLYGLTGLLS